METLGINLFFITPSVSVMNINFSHLSAAISEATKSAFIFKESPFESTPIGEITGINLSEIKFNNNEGST